jgi:nucleoid DNA-binding protein
MEAERRNASLLLIRETRFFKSAMSFMKKVLLIKKAQDRVKMAMQLTSFMPEEEEDNTGEKAKCVTSVLIDSLRCPSYTPGHMLKAACVWPISCGMQGCR